MWPFTNNAIKKLREEVLALHKTINTKLDRIIMNNAELKAQLDALCAQQAKIAVEQRAASAALQAEIARLTKLITDGGNVPTEVVESLDALKAKAQVVDDLVIDAPENPPAGETPA